ncbi:hypothetical protein ES705_46046 [subsurface metagenome]
MRQHVVAKEKIGGISFADHFPGCFCAEKFHQGLNPFLDGDLGDVRSWLYAEYGNSALEEVLQEVPVVTCDLHYVVCFIKSKALNHFLDVVFRMAKPGLREGGEISIVAEYILRSSNGGKLDQPALGA